jgi:hypothetical protein
MAGPHVPGPLGIRPSSRIGPPTTFTLGTGFATPGPLGLRRLLGPVTAEAETSGGIEDDLKRAARELVDDFARRIGPGAFSSLARGDIADGLRARIDNPSVIQQGPTQFCGPGSFIFSVASDDPVRYVRFAIDLYEQGQATLGNMHVQPDNDVLHSAPPSGQIAPVDWMVLGSVRDSENWFFDIKTGESIVRNGTNPHEIADWFREAGYTQVVDEANTVFSKDFNNADQASRLLQQGYKVVLYLRMGAFTPGEGGTHFVALTSPINVLNNLVDFDIFTWGEGHFHLPEAGQTLPLQRFLDNYLGFIAAKL